MTEKSYWQTIKIEGEGLLEKLRALIHEGNIRRVVIKQQNRTVAEFPLTAGIVGGVLAPIVAAIGALVALLNDCTIDVEIARTEDAEPSQRNVKS